MSYQSIEDLVIDIPDYPKAGVIFKDITPVVDDPEAFKEAVEALGDHFKGMGVTKVVSAEARGFLFGAPVAYQMGVGFVPARKPGKLPRECFSEEYALEYGTNSIEIHKDALTSDDKVLVVDDLVAKLAQKAGAEVVGFGFLMELAVLKPKQTIKDAFGLDLFSLIQVD